jgi:hypothetical protein
VLVMSMDSGGGAVRAEAARKVSDETMQLIADGKAATAMKQLQAHSALPAGAFSTFRQQAIATASQTKRLYGEVIGCDLVRVAKPTAYLCRCTYLLKYETRVLRWDYTFYRPKEKWLLTNVSFSDQMGDLFAPAAAEAG